MGATEYPMAKTSNTGLTRSEKMSQFKKKKKSIDEVVKFYQSVDCSPHPNTLFHLSLPCGVTQYAVVRVSTTRLTELSPQSSMGRNLETNLQLRVRGHVLGLDAVENRIKPRFWCIIVSTQLVSIIIAFCLFLLLGIFVAIVVMLSETIVLHRNNENINKRPDRRESWRRHRNIMFIMHRASDNNRDNVFHSSHSGRWCATAAVLYTDTSLQRPAYGAKARRCAAKMWAIRVDFISFNMPSIEPSHIVHSINIVIVWVWVWVCSSVMHPTVLKQQLKMPKKTTLSLWSRAHTTATWEFVRTSCCVSSSHTLHIAWCVRHTLISPGMNEKSISVMASRKIWKHGIKIKAKQTNTYSNIKHALLRAVCCDGDGELEKRVCVCVSLSLNGNIYIYKEHFPSRRYARSQQCRMLTHTRSSFAKRKLEHARNKRKTHQNTTHFSLSHWYKLMHACSRPLARWCFKFFPQSRVHVKRTTFILHRAEEEEKKPKYTAKSYQTAHNTPDSCDQSKTFRFSVRCSQVAKIVIWMRAIVSQLNLRYFGTMWRGIAKALMSKCVLGAN